MENIVLIIIGVATAYWLYKQYRKTIISKQEVFIDNYKFPQRLTQTLQAEYPHLSKSDLDLVMKGLKEYFHVCNVAGATMVAMPSQVVDIVWHDFILFTRKYESFCEKALGRFLHHTPAEAMSSRTFAQESIKVAWKIACQRENINPQTPTKLPLLFALDSILEIENGFKYSLNCSSKTGDAYCGGHIGCSGGSSGCTGDIGSADSGCGGGCGGN